MIDSAVAVEDAAVAVVDAAITVVDVTGAGLIWCFPGNLIRVISCNANGIPLGHQLFRIAVEAVGGLVSSAVESAAQWQSRNGASVRAAPSGGVAAFCGMP